MPGQWPILGGISRGALAEAPSVGIQASDVDVAVLFDQAPEPALSGAGLTLEGEIERHLGRRVDLVNLNRAPADLVHRVLRDGVTCARTSRRLGCVRGRGPGDHARARQGLDVNS